MTVPTPDGIVSRPVGLDFGAIILTAQTAGIATPMLAEILPRIEAAIVNPPSGVPEGEGDDGDS